MNNKAVPASEQNKFVRTSGWGFANRGKRWDASRLLPNRNTGMAPSKQSATSSIENFMGSTVVSNRKSANPNTMPETRKINSTRPHISR